MARQNYRLEVLSPLHIGSGQEYSALDGAYAQGRWYLIDISKVLSRSRVDPTNLANAMMQSDFRWFGWLQKHQIALSEVASHSVACPVNPEQTRIRAFLRDAYGRPYIPGSTLKGAIRTAVLEELVVQKSSDERKPLAEEITKPQNNKPHDRRYVARNTIERDLLIGKATKKANESNYDLLRALHISDSEPIERDQLQIGLIWVYTLRNGQLVQKRQAGGEYKLFAECLLVGVQTRLSIQIDEILLRDNYSRTLGFKEEQTGAIRDWISLCNARSKQIAEHEAQFYEDYALPDVARFYQSLLKRLESLEQQDGALLNIGWGGGWEMKTVTNPLTEGLDDHYEDIRDVFKLGRLDFDIFPKTRRIAFQNSEPYAPLGWVALIPEG